MPIRISAAADKTHGRFVGFRTALHAVAIAAVLCCASGTGASDLLSEDELDFFNGKTYREIVWIALQRAEKELRDPECVEPLSGAERVGIDVVERLVTEPDGRFPSSGVWRDKLAVTRCGVRHVHNLRFDAREQAAPKPMVLVPGQSIASAQMQFDAMAPLRALSFGRNQDSAACDDTQVRDTTAPTGLNGGEPDLSQGWVETWTVRACGELHQVPITFTRNGDGSTSILPGSPFN